MGSWFISSPGSGEEVGMRRKGGRLAFWRLYYVPKKKYEEVVVFIFEKGLLFNLFLILVWFILEVREVRKGNVNLL